jgi:hypothetical protein
MLEELRNILHELSNLQGHLVTEDNTRDPATDRSTRRDDNITHVSRIILKISELSDAYVDCLKHLGIRNLANEIRKIRIDDDEEEDNRAKTNADVGMRDVPSPVRQER